MLLPLSSSCCSGSSRDGSRLFKHGGMRVGDFLRLTLCEPGIVGLTNLLNQGDDGVDDADQPRDETLEVVGGLWSVVDHSMNSVKRSSHSLGCRRCRHS